MNLGLLTTFIFILTNISIGKDPVINKMFEPAFFVVMLLAKKEVIKDNMIHAVKNIP